MKELVRTLTEEFKDKEYAHAYMEEFSNMSIAAQIKALREQYDLSQEKLAELSGMKQERICALENSDYDSWTVKVLRRLAKAFDLTLKVSFEEFSSGILDVSNINKDSLKRTPRHQDLNNFSDNGYCHNEATIWSGPVTTNTCIKKQVTSGVIYPTFKKAA